MYPLESPHRGYSNECTQHTIKLLKIEKTSLNYSDLPSELALWLTPSGSSYPRLKQIFIIPKMFEPLKFDCNFCSDLRFKSVLMLGVISECPGALHICVVRPRSSLLGQRKRTSSSVSAGALVGQSLRFFHVSWCVDSNQILLVAAQPVPDHSSGRIQLFGCSEPSCGWCRPRVGATNCGVWSGYALSAASQHGD